MSDETHELIEALRRREQEQADLIEHGRVFKKLREAWEKDAFQVQRFAFMGARAGGVLDGVVWCAPLPILEAAADKVLGGGE